VKKLTSGSEMISMIRKLKKTPSRIQFSSLLLWTGLLLLGAVSCQADQTQLPVAQTPELKPTQTQEAAEPTPSEESAAESGEGEAALDDQCLICHTDQQTLIDTAAPLVVLENESSGEG
jgi:hypothetical protein